MPVQIRIPAALRRLTGGAKRIDAVGTTLGEALRDAVRAYPDLGARLFDGDALRADARVFIAGEEPADGLDTALGDGDEVTILPPIAGA